jgi:hypothetical protein
MMYRAFKWLTARPAVCGAAYRRCRSDSSPSLNALTQQQQCAFNITQMCVLVSA